MEDPVKQHSVEFVPFRSLEERNSLVLKWYYLPRHIIKRLRGIPSVKNLDVEDAEQIGFEYLIRAADRWDAERGVKFQTYAYRVIMTGIVDSSRRKRQLPLLQLTCYDSPEKIAEEPDRGSLAKMDLYEGGVLDALELLPERWAIIVRETCWKGRTYESVGKQLNLTKERIRQIRKQALDWLRAYLMGEQPAPPLDTIFPMRGKRRKEFNVNKRADDKDQTEDV